MDEAQHWLQQLSSSYTQAHDDANRKVTKNYFIVNLTLKTGTENIVN